MPLIATRGAASAQGFGEFAQTAAPVYIEDVFSTWLYVGNGSTQTITNGIDLSGKGGFVWTKNRDTGGTNHILCDTARGITNYINSNNTNGQNANGVLTDVLTGTTTSGYTLGADATLQAVNVSTKTYVSWTFRKQPKFFDIVTYTGNGTNGRAISHALASSPGCVIIKSLNNSGTGYDGWYVRHRSATGLLYLNLTNAQEANFGSNITALSSTTVTVGGDCNENGETYVMYLFAHNAGGFGLTGLENVISCGSYTGDASTPGPTVTLGYEPQWLMIKRIDAVGLNGSWFMYDNMRGLPLADAQELTANSNAAEGPSSFNPFVTATGFYPRNADSRLNASGGTYIYIAVRKGPMKTPETGASVFTPTAFSGNDTSGTRSAGLDSFDLLISKRTASSALDWVWLDKLRRLAGNRWISSDSTSAETASGGTLDTINTINGQYTQNGINITKTSNYSYLDAGGSNYVWYALKRAPGFFDEVCYTGNAAGTNNQNHNLGVTPEMLIFKTRNNTDNWRVFLPVQDTYTVLNSTSGKLNGGSLPSAVTSTTFNVGSSTGYSSIANVNASGDTYICYLFATLAGVSKVGSYTGTGALQTVNCGFTSGARFVMIKRTDTSGDWFVYDSAQGISSGNDPYLRMNLDAVQVTGTNYVDTTSVGFQVTAAAPVGLNASGGTYIFLAIA